MSETVISAVVMMPAKEAAPAVGCSLIVSVVAVVEEMTAAPVVEETKLTFWAVPPAVKVSAVVPVIEPVDVPVPPSATAISVPFHVPVVTTPVLAVIISPL